MLFRRPFKQRWFLFAAVLCVTAPGCESIEQNFMPHRASAPAAAPQRAPSRESAAAPISSSATAPKRGKTKSKAPPNRNAAPPVLTLGPAANPGGAGAGGKATAQMDAEQAVNRAAQQLQGVDRSKLTESGAAEYGVVAGMIESAQRALNEKDFLRARRLAGKAAVLAAELASSGAGRH